MELDIERLHDVIEGRRRERGDGQTTASLVQVLQSAELAAQLQYPGARYAYVADRESVLQQYQHRALEIARVMGIRIQNSWVRNSFYVFGEYDNEKAEVMFIPVHRLRQTLGGIRLLNYFLDHHIQTLTYEDKAFLETRVERK